MDLADVENERAANATAAAVGKMLFGADAG